MTFDPRFITGAALLVVGAFVCVIPLRLWLLHPVNRVLRIGPYVTTEGLTFLLNSRGLMFAIGLSLIVTGLSRIVYALHSERLVGDAAPVMLGGLEAGLATWAAAMSLRGAYRLWFRK